MPRKLTDAERLKRAIDSTGMSDRAFAAQLLDVDGDVEEVTEDFPRGR